MRNCYFGERVDGTLYISSHGNIYNQLKFYDGKVTYLKGCNIVHEEFGVSNLVIKRPHVLIDHDCYRKPLELVSEDRSYTDNTRLIFNCSSGDKKLLPFLEKTDKIVAEIGIKFGATTKLITESFPNIDQYYCFERRPEYCEFLKKTLSDSRIILMEGNAADTLKMVDVKFDFVYFDASHNYEIDSLILTSLIPKLKDSTKIVFDDYNIPDIRRLCDEFVLNAINPVWVFEDDNVMRLK